MRSAFFVFTVVAATILIPAGQLSADIVNGSFTAGLVDPWETDIIGDSSAFADAAISSYGGSSNVLKLTASNTYTWADDEWTQDQIDVSRTAVGQGDITVQEGTTALQFHAAALYVGPDAGNFGGRSETMPTMLVSVFYRITGDSRLKTSTLAIADADWNTLRQIDLPANLNVSIPLEVQIVVTSQISQNDSHDTLTAKSIEVAGYADDLAFVVPEPATMTLLAIGALGLLRRRKA